MFFTECFMRITSKLLGLFQATEDQRGDKSKAQPYVVDTWKDITAAAAINRDCTLVRCRDHAQKFIRNLLSFELEAAGKGYPRGVRAIDGF